MELNDIQPGDILYFTADWCTPCQYFKPIVKEISDEFNVDIKELNIEENTSLGKQLGVKSVPQIIQVHPVDRYSIKRRIKGAHAKENLVTMLGLE